MLDLVPIALFVTQFRVRDRHGWGGEGWGAVTTIKYSTCTSARNSPTTTRNCTCPGSPPTFVDILYTIPCSGIAGSRPRIQNPYIPGQWRLLSGCPPSLGSPSAVCELKKAQSCDCWPRCPEPTAGRARERGPDPTRDLATTVVAPSDLGCKSGVTPATPTRS